MERYRLWCLIWVILGWTVGTGHVRRCAVQLSNVAQSQGTSGIEGGPRGGRVVRGLRGFLGRIYNSQHKSPIEYNHKLDFWLAGAQFTLNCLSVRRCTPSREPGRMYKQVFHCRILFCVHDMFDKPGRLVCVGKMSPRVMLAALATSCLSSRYPPPSPLR